MLHDTEPSSTFWSSVQDVAFQVLQLIDIRLALVIGLAAFMLAVGFDSSGNQAEAADLVNRSALVPISVAVNEGVGGDRLSMASQGAASRLGEAPVAMAHRLRHGSLTRAMITNNRLTDAHFFIDLPAEP